MIYSLWQILLLSLTAALAGEFGLLGKAEGGVGGEDAAVAGPAAGRLLPPLKPAGASPAPLPTPSPTHGSRAAPPPIKPRPPTVLCTHTRTPRTPPIQLEAFCRGFFFFFSF